MTNNLESYLYSSTSFFIIFFVKVPDGNKIYIFENKSNLNQAHFFVKLMIINGKKIFFNKSY